MFTRNEIYNYCDHYEGLDIVYRKALETAKLLPADIPFVEIGVREGGSTLVILKAILDSGNIKRAFFTIDCYGNKIFDDREENYLAGMKNIALYCFKNRLCWIPFRMKSFDFFKVFPQISIYKNIDKFGFVHLDGDHLYTVVSEELEWFWKRTIKDGIISIDDIENIQNKDDKLLNRFLEQGEIVRNRIFLKVR